MRLAGTMQPSQTGASFDGTRYASSFICTSGFNGGSGSGSVGGTSTWVSSDGSTVTMTGNWTAHR